MQLFPRLSNLQLFLNLIIYPQVLEFVAEGRVQRRRRDQKPLPQRILDLMKDGNPNEAHQGIVIAEFFRNLYQFPSQAI